MNTQRLGHYVSALRAKLDTPQSQIAEEVGISRGYYTDIELDRRIPHLKVLKRLIDVLGGDLETGMRLAGKIPVRRKELLSSSPAAWLLFEKMTELQLSEEQIKELVKLAIKLGGGTHNGRK